MVYMAGENNLAQSLEADLEEMKSAGSTDDVNIVVQADVGFSGQFSFADGYTHRFMVRQGWLEDYPLGYNADMASPNELAAFISWAVSAFPAEHYMLVLWDHGLGWIGGQENGTGAENGMSAPVRGILEDAGSHSFMSLSELNQALAAAGTRFDVIEFDACLMGMWEVAHAVKDWSSFLTFSQATEPASGDPYGLILSDIISHPWMDGRAVAEKIVDDYLGFYQNSGVMDLSVTKSAVDTASLQELTERINRLAGLMNGSFEDMKDKLVDIRQAVQAFPELPGSIDLGDFLARLIEAGAGGEILAEASALEEFLYDSVVIKHGFHNAEYVSVLAGSSDLSGSHGLSIFMPLGRELVQGELDQYAQVQAVQEAPDWLEFVQKFSGETGLIPDEEAAEGGFLLGVYWSSIPPGSFVADLDLYVIEPSGVYSPWTGHSTPNGYFSLDSVVSGLGLEYYAARPVVRKGIYIPVINYRLSGTFNSWWHDQVMAYFYYVPQYGSQEVYQEGPRFMSLLNPAPDDWDDQVLERLSRNYYSDWWIPASIQKALSRASIEARRCFWERIKSIKGRQSAGQAFKSYGMIP